jgi:hypothetical protein
MDQDVGVHLPKFTHNRRLKGVGHSFDMGTMGCQLRIQHCLESLIRTVVPFPCDFSLDCPERSEESRTGPPRTCSSLGQHSFLPGKGPSLQRRCLLPYPKQQLLGKLPQNPSLERPGCYLPSVPRCSTISKPRPLMVCPIRDKHSNSFLSPPPGFESVFPVRSRKSLSGAKFEAGGGRGHEAGPVAVSVVTWAA